MDTCSTFYGPFRIDRRIGGTEAVVLYRAERTGVAGFRRPSLVTVLHPHLSGAEVAREFLEVASVFGRVASPRVASIEDVGEDHGSLYHAYASREGIRLAAAVDSGAARGSRVSLAAAIWIGTEPRRSAPWGSARRGGSWRRRSSLA
jgi:hypothetical protein